MALFKILKGPEAALPTTKKEGWAYVTNEGNFYVDISDTLRVKINSNADFSIKAENDSSNQKITDTYIKDIIYNKSGTAPYYTLRLGNGILKATNGITDQVIIPVANTTDAGVVTIDKQTFAGAKTFNALITAKLGLTSDENISTAKQLISTIKNGTAPLVVSSKALVTNLNADTVDGMHASNNSFTQANASNTTLPTQLAIWNSLNSLLISAQALVYRGTLTPAQFKALSASGVSKGDVFVVSAEGNFGGKYCEPGDMLICYDKTSTAVTWDIVQTNIDGSVVIKGGGAAATVHADVHAIARFDSNTGRVIDNSKVFIDDNGHVTAKATETQDIGTSDNKWRTIYAKSFNGLATNATADSSGQNIMDTYLKDWTLTKHATQPFVTLTKGNGNTSDINLPIAGQNDAGLITNAAQTIYGVKTFNTSIIAKSNHDFISHGNEFNVVPKLSANIAFNFNYRQKDGNGAGKITQYNFCNGAGGILASISQGQFSGNAATATKATQDSDGNAINTTYLKKTDLKSSIINIDGFGKTYTFTKTVAIGTNWTSVGIASANLPSGVYIVYMTGIWDTDKSWQNSNIYAGIMSWYNGGTNSGERSEILLHTTGHAHNEYRIFLSTLSHVGNSANSTTLEIKSNITFTRNTTITFKFVKMV